MSGAAARGHRPAAAACAMFKGLDAAGRAAAAQPLPGELRTPRGGGVPPAPAPRASREEHPRRGDAPRRPAPALRDSPPRPRPRRTPGSAPPRRRAGTPLAMTAAERPGAQQPPAAGLPRQSPRRSPAETNRSAGRRRAPLRNPIGLTACR